MPTGVPAVLGVLVGSIVLFAVDYFKFKSGKIDKAVLVRHGKIALGSLIAAIVVLVFRTF